MIRKWHEYLSMKTHFCCTFNSLNTGLLFRQGIKANMERLYQLVTEDQFNRCSKPSIYKKLLFSLCFFHSILLERKRFLQLGWNIVYGFNNSDFEVTNLILKLFNHLTNL